MFLDKLQNSEGSVSQQHLIDSAWDQSQPLIWTSYLHLSDIPDIHQTCLLDVDIGNCKANFTRYYYSTTNDVCIKVSIQSKCQLSKKCLISKEFGFASYQSFLSDVQTWGGFQNYNYIIIIKCKMFAKIVTKIWNSPYLNQPNKACIFIICIMI